MARLVAACLLCLSASLTAQSRVLIVDPDDPVADFHRISTAATRAASGSVILVRGGVYGAGGAGEDIVIDGKSLLLTTEPGALVEVHGHVTIQNIRPEQSVTLIGLTLEGDEFLAASSTVLVRDSAGAVWIEDCDVTTSPITQGASQRALTASRSAQVLLVGSRFVSRTFPLDLRPGDAGIEAVSSTLHLFGSTGQGGPGGSNGLGQVSEGGSGFRLTDSFVFVDDSTLQGGRGGQGQNGFGCADGGPGGPGAELLGTNPQLFSVNSRLLGGPGGVPVGAGSCSNGAPGPPTRVAAGTVTQGTSPAHGFEVEPRAVAPGEAFELRFSGQPLETAFYLVAPGPRGRHLPGLGGSLALASPLLIGRPGMLDATGSLVQSLSFQPPGDVLAVWLQAVFLDVNGITLGPPATLQFIAPRVRTTRPRE